MQKKAIKSLEIREVLFKKCFLKWYFFKSLLTNNASWGLSWNMHLVIQSWEKLEWQSYKKLRKSELVQENDNFHLYRVSNFIEMHIEK